MTKNLQKTPTKMYTTFSYLLFLVTISGVLSLHPLHHSVIPNKKKTASSLSSIIDRKLHDQHSAEEFCADLSDVKSHVDDEFDLFFEGERLIYITDGFSCTCIQQEPILLECTLKYTYDDTDSIYTVTEMATFFEMDGKQSLSTTAWSTEDSVTGEMLFETFEYCADGESLCSCNVTGVHGCNSCAVCANGKHVTLYDCSDDPAYATSCDDNYEGAFVNSFDFPKIGNRAPIMPSTTTHTAFCADLSDVKSHVDDEFDLFFEGDDELILISDGFSCMCTSQEPIMLECTLTYTYDDTDSNFTVIEMATFNKMEGKQSLSTTGWSTEDSVTGEMISETFEYCADGENLCSCNVSGVVHGCNSCAVCANGKHVTLYDCSDDPAYATSCDDNYEGAFVNYFDFPKIENPEDPTSSAISHYLTTSFLLGFTLTAVIVWMD